MKKSIKSLTVMILVAALTACGSAPADSVSENTVDSSLSQEISEDTADSNMTADSAASSNTRMFALGKPFPNFTVETTDGTFTLSEAMEGKEVTIVNFWATWCGYCGYEFPFIDEVYKNSDGKVAVIALSIDPADSPEMIEEYRDELDLSFPMASDETSLYSLLREQGIPASVVIDRFGNVVTKKVGAFMSVEELNDLLSNFTGDDYTETTVIK